MKQIHSYILKQFVGPLVTTFFIIIFVLLMQFIWLYIDDIVGKGLEISVVLEFFYLATLRLIELALPLTILLASLMTFGNLGERLELLSMKAAGVSLLKIMAPMMVLVVVISIGAFFFTNHVQPMATKKFATLMHDINRKKPDINLKEGVFNYDLSGLAIRISTKDKESGMLYGLQIYDHNANEGNTNVTLADSGMFSEALDGNAMILTLYSGEMSARQKEDGQRYDKLRVPYRRDTFSMQVMRYNFDNDLKRSNDEIYDKVYFSKNLNQLKLSSDSLTQQYWFKTRRYQKRIKAGNYKINFEIGKKEDFDSLRVSLGAINVDSALHAMAKSRQEQVVLLAINNANQITKELEQRKRSTDSELLNIRKHNIEIFKKFRLSFGCLIFLFIGAPLGAIIRKGGFGMPVVLSIVFFLIYYVLDQFGQKFAKEGVLEVWQGVWFSSIIYTPFAVFLTYQAITDSVLLNTDAYAMAFKKFFNFGKRLKKK